MNFTYFKMQQQHLQDEIKIDVLIEFEDKIQILFLDRFSSITMYLYLISLSRLVSRPLE